MDANEAAVNFKWAVKNLVSRNEQPCTLNEIETELRRGFPTQYKNRSRSALKRDGDLAVRQGLVHKLRRDDENSMDRSMRFTTIGWIPPKNVSLVHTHYRGYVPFEYLCRQPNLPGYWQAANIGFNLPRAWLGEQLTQQDSVRSNEEPISSNEYDEFLGRAEEILQTQLELVKFLKKKRMENEEIQFGEIPAQFQEEYKSMITTVKRGIAEYREQTDE